MLQLNDVLLCNNIDLPDILIGSSDHSDTGITSLCDSLINLAMRAVSQRFGTSSSSLSS